MREGQLGQEAEDAVAERRIGGTPRRSTREVKVAGIVDQQRLLYTVFLQINS
jgi:hypothetical protein